MKSVPEYRDAIYIPSSDAHQTHDLPSRTGIGGKAFNLRRLSDTAGRVPPWFCLSSTLFDEVIANHDDTLPNFSDAAQRVQSWQFPPSLEQELARLSAVIGNETATFAVRSSAAVEDSGEHSFAGQFESVLNVRPEDVPEAIRQVWLSACSERVEAYLRMRGLPLRVPSIAAIVQRMIPAEVSGVAFGCDPVTGDRDTVIISSLFGLGEGLVSGALDADTYRIRFDGPTPVISSEIVRKEFMIVADPDAPEGTTHATVPDDRADAPSLSDEQVLEIAWMVRKLGDRLGGAQDVEWVIAEGELHTLQTRPVTTLDRDDASSGESERDRRTRYVWDNSNIIESYSGVTTPLTFSFIDTVYSEVYRELTRILGVSERTIEQNRPVFSMLGLIRGRVYYNLLNWYRVLALLPGYQVNARFMEGMMGVSEPLEEKPDIVPPRGLQLPRLVWSIWRLIRNLITLPRNIDRFQEHVNRVLGPFENRSLDEMSESDLVALYHTLERELLLRWRTPILNDFYTMIFHGLLRKLIPIEQGEGDRIIENDLLVGEGGIISIEPMRMLGQIGALIREHPVLRDAFIEDAREGFAEAQRVPAVAGMIGEYLRRFGNRYAGELRLETITPAQRPELLAETVRGYVVQHNPTDVSQEENLADIRHAAEMWVTTSERISPIRKWIFRRVLKATRRRIRNRENLRFERTRVFAVVRAIALGLGTHLKRRGILEAERDVFYLTLEELFSLATNDVVELRTGDALHRPADLVGTRKEEFARYSEEPAPPDRFITLGHPSEPGFTIVRETGEIDSGSDSEDTLRGLPCSPGIVRGPVRIVRDPSEPGELAGHILVAERTDPGWGPLFPLATGLLVERGSLLSHSAIVAREMGIPAVVAVPRLLDRLVDGEMVEFDGRTGIIRRLDAPVTSEEGR